MAGPAASIILPVELTPSQSAAIDSLPLQIGKRYDDNSPRVIDLSVENTKPIGGSYRGEGRPILVDRRRVKLHSDAPEFEEHEIQRLVEEFNIEPRFMIDVSAGCKSKADHQVLAELCYHLAVMLNGIIHFGGAILPCGPEWLSDDWDVIEPRFLEWATEFPAKIVSVPYETFAGGTWISHYCTPEFLKAWIEHPDFHMIK